MSYDSTKLSNFIGQSDDPKKLKDYLLSVDKDLQSLFLTASTFYQFGTGSNFSILTYSSTNYAWFASVGAWSITNALLYGGSGSTYIGLQPGVGVWMGDAAFANAVFSVDPTGQMKAHAGRIGGWYIGTSTLSSTSITLDSVNDKITVGSSGLANINIDGENAKITVGNVGSTYIDIDGANTKIQSSDFVSGALGSGWRIDSNVGEFQNLRARGKFTTSIFEKDAISSIGGNLLVMPSDILDTDMTALDISTITILGDEIFAINDILRIKDGVDDEWFEVTSVSQTTYTVTRDKAGDYAADSNPIWTKGTAVVNYGASGEGGVFMTSSETDAPYIHFFTHAGSPWSATTAKCRIGNLNGITGCSGYGIWGGDGYLGQLEVIDIISITGQQGEIRSNSSGNYPYLSFSQGGLQLKDSDPGGTYGTAVYGTDKYGYGALVWILNTSLKIPWAELKEPNAGASDVASIRLYNRSDDPGGLAEVGDLAVVSGKLKICTGAGTPGTWTVVGSQTA